MPGCEPTQGWRGHFQAGQRAHLRQGQRGVVVELQQQAHLVGGDGEFPAAAGEVGLDVDAGRVR